MTSARRRVMLITPPYHTGVVEAAGVWLPLHLVYLAGAARQAGAEVYLYDAMSLRHDHDAIAKEIERFRPDVVGVTAITAMEPDARRVCRSAKAVDPRILTLLGNQHPTFMWREILGADPAVEAIVCGEGEQTLAEVVAAVAATPGAAHTTDLGPVRGVAWRRDGIAVQNPPRPLCADLDRLTPAWDAVDWPRYFYRPHPAGRLAIISTSRGCQKQCSFCSQQKFWARSWRGRRPLAVVEELERLRDRFDVQVAMLADETPTVDPTRWQEILRLLIDRRVGVELLMETRIDDILRDAALLGQYRAAGISHIYVGVESTSQATLDLYKKETRVADAKRAIAMINDHGIVSETSFVLGTLDETPASIARTVELAKWYAPDMAFFLALTPWPYADLYPQLEAHVTSRDYSRYNLIEPVVKPRSMTIDEVRRALLRATGSFFHDKFARLESLPAAKRAYLVDVLKLLIEHSYLKDHMREMAAQHEMPAAVAAMLATLGE
ncbi:MAG: cobalamin B12-binding domain-containing protein [Deltaproteobacteria bacterium]|nr:cobalamin B12-binding domain-containing protein [Deltaproteobacteria bacterium]